MRGSNFILVLIISILMGNSDCSQFGRTKNARVLGICVDCSFYLGVFDRIALVEELHNRGMHLLDANSHYADADLFFPQQIDSTGIENIHSPVSGHKQPYCVCYELFPSRNFDGNVFPSGWHFDVKPSAWHKTAKCRIAFPQH